MNLTTKQEEGLNIAVDRYKNHEAYTCIAGYAGKIKLWTKLTKNIITIFKI